MVKKIKIFILVICLCLIPSEIANAQSNGSEDNKAELLKEDGTTSYYLNENKIMKVVVSEQEPISTLGEAVNDEIKMASSEVDIRFYESETLTLEEIELARAGELTKVDEATNPMGNVKAKLTVKYSFDSYSNLLRLISATSSYNILIAEGVSPQTCSLYWHAEGKIYNNGTFVKNGILGNELKYVKPTFTNVTIMPAGQSIDPFLAGVRYTLNCTRGVTIAINIPFA